ncbi:MAG: transcription-repair coupling factor [Syntrophomonadaceae bacterium]|nr:transcription-repair coupling factor [Syntrophomonadaceae bacterium]
MLTAQIMEQLRLGADCMFSGLSGGARVWFFHRLYELSGRRLLVLVPDEEQLVDLARDLRKLVPHPIGRFPARELVFIKENNARSEMERLYCLQELARQRLHTGEQATGGFFIIATAGGMMHRIKSPGQLAAGTINLARGLRLPRRELMETLIGNGYERVDTVVRPGHVAVRGSIVDIYPAGSSEGLRVDFFDDEIDFIRRFDPDSQLTTGALDEAAVGPADEIDGHGLSSLLDYLPEGSLIVLDEPREFYKTLERHLRRTETSLREATREGKELPDLPRFNAEQLKAALDGRQKMYHSFFPGSIAQAAVGMYQHITQIEMESYAGRETMLWAQIKRWQREDWRIVFSPDTVKQQQDLQQKLVDEHISGVEFIKTGLKQGFSSPAFKLALFTGRDLFGYAQSTRKKKKSSEEDRVLLEDLRPGEYVVHENYGIGLFHGVTRVTTDGVTREYLLLQYAGADKLYLPVEKLDLLYRYSGVGDKQPRLHKLGGTEWERTRAKVQQSIEELADELLKLYAQRENTVGYAFAPDTPWQYQFEGDFPYHETPDQLKAIAEVKRDMESSRPMDRLLCGDVGYGKTEVALRAVFKAVMDGKQAAILVPTTVLAEQHGETFRARMENYPITVEVLSRFRTPKQQKKIIADVKSGAVDVIIATHRLLSSDLDFYDLGLLVVDEEHRFGVMQKEKIKSLKTKVDVLSLSATPIPRSLHMSMTGLRDLSVIETPPPDRYPINTYVMEYNPEIVREAVMSELARGGQVFFVHNRVQDIHKIESDLRELLPQIRIAVGHGQMNEQELAQVLIDFNAGRFDMLLCTTIIESGLDMPNVNTMIVDMADRLGLAQLYQLRGRVGRSSRVASAYLCYRPDRTLNEEAQKRLNAIREFNELGAGLRIALRDLEIRGAGNILGGEQHGHIYAVGFDLYCRMLQEQAAILRGEEHEPVLQPQLDIDADYYLPDHYIPDPGTRMRLYKRLLQAPEESALDDISAEIIDRFGPEPEPVRNFIIIARLRLLARNQEIKSLKRVGQHIEIETIQPLYRHKMQLKSGRNLKLINANTVRLIPDDSGLEGLLELFRSM